MHDPQTVIRDFEYPWYRDKPWPKKYRNGKWEEMPEKYQKGRNSFYKEGYRDTFVTLWHVDPESDGTDDSCGWFSPKLTDEERKEIKLVCKNELKNFYIPSKNDPEYFTSKVDVFTGVYDIIATLAWRVWRKRILPKHLPEILSVSTSHWDSFSNSFENGKYEYRKSDIERTFLLLGIFFKRLERKWWDHPRYHIHHYKIQIHPLLHFKRWAFSRCNKCGKRFKWGESPVSHGWGGEGPQWFKSEKGVEHMSCNNIQVGSASA